MEAFIFLDKSRPSGFETGYIPLTEIEAYSRIFGVGDEELFTVAMREVDARMIKSARGEREQKRGGRKGNGSD